jgi:4-amino-4-deoxy-L-arabinose transferase-like glycosyltransferase
VSQRRRLEVLALILAVYAGLAVATSLRVYVWENEAWFASPAVTLDQKGYLGTTILESKGTWMDGIERRTYWVPPVHLLVQAAWYQLFGFSLFSLRSISILAGAAALLGWYVVVSNLSENRTVALLAVGFIATDSHFITYASLGRPDMLCAALGSLAFAAYLNYRNRSLLTAILCAHGLAAASCLTHPCGLLYAAGLVLLMVYFDRRRLRWLDFAGAAMPYLAGLAAWSVYILQAPSQFVHQFTGNISGIASEFTSSSRFSDLASPLRALKREFFLRYGSNFGWYQTGFAIRAPLFVLLVYSLAVAAALFAPRIRNHSGYRALLLLGSLDFVVMALFDGLKGSAYLVHTLPLCASLLAICIHVWTTAWTKPFAHIPLAAILTVFGGVQFGTILHDLLDQPQRQDYQAALDFLRRAKAPGQIIAAGEFAFDLGFDSGLVDDPRLGYFSGRRPSFIVASSIYRGWFERSAVLYPDIHRYLVQLLDHDYRVAFHNSSYTVYVTLPQISNHGRG